MSTNLSRIREALQRNNVILENGELRVDEPRQSGAITPRHQGAPRQGKQGLQSPAPADPVAENPPAAVRIKPTTWAAPEPWYTQARYAGRFSAECAAVLAQTPAARLAVTDDDTLFWDATVRTLGGQDYRISVVYPQTFPYGELQVFVLSPTLLSSPHQFSNGQLCLGHAFGACTSAVTTAAWAATWLSAYEVYRATGNWPEFVH